MVQKIHILILIPKLTHSFRRRALLGEPGEDVEIPVPPGVSVRTDHGLVIGINEHYHLYRPQRSCEGYVFTRVCLSNGGGIPGQVHPPDQAHPTHPREAPPRPPPGRRLTLRTVRILLECILV